MKIPFYVRKAYPGEDRLFAYVSVAIRVDRYRIHGHFDAIVDIGSPRTVMAYKDAVTLKVSFKSLTSSTPLRVGGLIFPTYNMKDVLFGVMNGEGMMERINTPMVNVLNRPTKYKGEIKHMPSLIGTDFLENHKLTLHFDVFNKRAYLDENPITC